LFPVRPLLQSGPNTWGLIGIVQDITDYVSKREQNKDNEQPAQNFLYQLTLPFTIFIRITPIQKIIGHKYGNYNFLGFRTETIYIGKELILTIYDKATSTKIPGMKI